MSKINDTDGAAILGVGLLALAYLASRGSAKKEKECRPPEPTQEAKERARRRVDEWLANRPPYCKVRIERWDSDRHKHVTVTDAEHFNVLRCRHADDIRAITVTQASRAFVADHGSVRRFSPIKITF